MNSSKYLFLIIALFINAAIYAQNNYKEGFIITLENDTIFGGVSYRSDLEKVIFTNNTLKANYSSVELAGYGFTNGELFHSIATKKNYFLLDERFVQVLVYSSDLTLYKDSDDFIIKKKNESFTLKKNHNSTTDKWRGVVSFLLSDCLSEKEVKIATTKLDSRDLSKLVAKYNYCKGSNFTTHFRYKKWNNISVGIVTGVAVSKLNIKRSSNGERYLLSNYKSTNPQFGLMLEINSPNTSKKLSYQFGSYFSTAAFSSFKSIPSGPVRVENHSIKISLTTLSVPISFKYKLNNGKNSVYTLIGFDNNIVINSNLTQKSEASTRGVIEILGGLEPFNISRYQIGAQFGLGYLVSIGKTSIGIQATYTQMSNLNASGQFNARINKFETSFILKKN